MGFDRVLIQIIISLIFGKNICDFAPNTGYGRDYIIQY